jgi:hypothetical protein
VDWKIVALDDNGQISFRELMRGWQSMSRLPRGPTFGRVDLDGLGFRCRGDDTQRHNARHGAAYEVAVGIPKPEPR